MRKFILAIGVLFSMGLVAQQPFTLKFDLKNSAKFSKLYISIQQGSKYKKDSVMLNVKNPQFAGTIAELSKVYVSTEPNGGLYRQIFVGPNEKLTFQITNDEIDFATVTGSDLNVEYGRFLKTVEAEIRLDNKYTEEQKNFKRKSVEWNALEDKMEALYYQRKDKAEKFIIANPNSKASLYIYSDYLMREENAEEIYNKLTEGAKADKKLVANIEKNLERERKTKIGNVAPLFSSKTADGTIVELKSFRGKYVLIDFWASWCGPCRAENPNVLKAYQQFHDKNFEVLGVSLDSKREAWIKAVEDDKLPWTQVCDINGFKMPYVEDYGVVAIPSNFLLNPEGVIIAKNLRGDNLAKTLAKFLK